MIAARATHVGGSGFFSPSNVCRDKVPRRVPNGPLLKNATEFPTNTPTLVLSPMGAQTPFPSAMCPLSTQKRLPPRVGPGALQGEHRIVNLVGALNVGYSVQLANNAGLGNGSGGTRSGDSGGLILHMSDMIVALNSFGIALHCKGNEFTWRVDRENPQGFLNQFVDLDD